MAVNQRVSHPLTIEDLTAAGAPDQLAISDVHGNGLTYSELRSLTVRTHDSLASAGVGRSDTVAFSLANGPETAALFLALASYCRVAPLNPKYTAREIAFSLEDLKARAIIATVDETAAAEAAAATGAILMRFDSDACSQPGAFRLQVEQPNSSRDCAPDPPGPDEIALLLHTSGTTARPKLVPLTQRNLTLSTGSVCEVLQLSPKDRCLSVMPLFHIHGLVAGLLAPIAAGSTVCCAPSFQATRFFSWLDSTQATWYTAVPTMHQAILLRARHNSEILSRHKLRLIRSSSSPLYPAVWEQLESVFDVPVLNAYGMTEAAHQVTSVRLAGGPRVRGTVGHPAGLDVAILDDTGEALETGRTGEVALRGPQIMGGYLRPEGVNEAAFINGWFRTGDQGFLEPDGALTLSGRIKEIINSGGEKISPYEVEEALLEHPAIAQAVVFAIPHALLGEAVAAAVVLHDGCGLAERELIESAGSRLTRCKVPRRVVFVDELPRGATGKPQRIGLAARLGIAPEEFAG